jgi:UDP-N-acetylmuramoyl-tripeptide--D-alanyl-D-alanine ligase
VLTLREVLEATSGELLGGQHAPLDRRFSRVAVDSRAVTPGTLFVALKGERHDGHTFVPETLAHGAAAALVERLPADCADGATLIQVPDTRRALADMARFALAKQPNLEVVGITGSLGKTTTKEVVASVLATQKRVLKSEGNLNSEIGLPMTVLNGLAPDHEVAVLEMAMYQVGDIRFLAQLARPRIGVVTAVQPVHLERLGTIERIHQAKQELVEELPPNGVAVLNADDPRVASMATATPARVVRYGVTPHAEVRAERIHSRGLDGVDFDLLLGGDCRHVHLPLFGAQNVPAALAAAAVASEEGMALAEIAGGLEQLSPALRLLVLDGVNGARILDDSYNASPESVVAALNLLGELPGQRKIAVLGDMAELGAETEPGHRRVGDRAAAVVDVLVVFGAASRITAEAAQRAGLRSDQVHEATSHDEIVDLLRREMRAGDDVLVKGSLVMGMSKVVRGIKAGD